MTQLPSFDEQAIAQLEFEQYINRQSLLMLLKQGTNYSTNSQIYSFLTGKDNPDISINERAASQQPAREPIKHLLIGSPKAVTITQGYLHHLGYALIGDWSPFLPTVNSGEVMSILSKQIVVQ